MNQLAQLKAQIAAKENTTTFAVTVYFAEEKENFAGLTKIQAQEIVRKFWNRSDCTYQVFHMEKFGKNAGSYEPTNMRSFWS